MVFQGISRCKGVKVNLFSKSSKEFFILVLLVHLFHLLKTVVNEDLYMSHTLSRNKMEESDLEVTMWMRES